MPVLVSAVVLVTELSAITLAISPVPAVEPVSVSVLIPAPEAPKVPVKLKSPVPDWLMVPPPVVPGRSRFRSVVLLLPV